MVVGVLRNGMVRMSPFCSLEVTLVESSPFRRWWSGKAMPNSRSPSRSASKTQAPAGRDKTRPCWYCWPWAFAAASSSSEVKKTKTCSRDKWIFLIYINLITSYNTYHHRSTLLHIHTYLVVTFFHKAAFSLLFDLSWCDSARFTTGTSIDSQYLFFFKRWRFEHRMVSYFVFSAVLWRDPSSLLPFGMLVFSSFL